MSTHLTSTTSVGTTTITTCSIVPTITRMSMSTKTATLYWGELEELVQVTVQFNVGETCAHYRLCAAAVRPDADIAGIGTIAAFLITAFAALIFLIVAYCSGLLPDTILRTADKRCFGAHSKNCKSQWRETLERITFVFSDQQLITGLSMMIAGYYEVFHDKLDLYHWQNVVQLTWMSSTVHLISLSLLRDRLNENHMLRNIRVCGMLILAVLLAVALVPSLYVVETPTAMPVRCLWNPRQNLRLDNEDPLSQYADDPIFRYQPGAVVMTSLSMVTLFIGFAWKLSQLFETSRKCLSRWARAVPQCLLEHAAAQAANQSYTSRARKHRYFSLLKYKSIVYIYLVVMLWTEALESFLATVIYLAFTLAYGTGQLFTLRHKAFSHLTNKSSDSLKKENALSFGQLLPLLLLLQPVMAVIEHFAQNSERVHRSALSQLTQPETVVVEGQELKTPCTNTSTDLPPVSDNLTQVFQLGALLTSNDKLSRQQRDPVVEHIYISQLFRFLMCLLYFATMTILGMAVFMAYEIIPRIGPKYTMDQFSYASAISTFLGMTLGSIAAFACLVGLLLPCSRRLR